jgi:predicted secreted protein
MLPFLSTLIKIVGQLPSTKLFFPFFVENFTPNLQRASESTPSIKTEPVFLVPVDKTKESEAFYENLEKVNERSVDISDKIENKEERNTIFSTTGEEQTGNMSSIGTVKRRRPRERRVPSTPFTRALG